MRDLRRAETSQDYTTQLLKDLRRGKVVLVPVSSFDDCVVCGGDDGGDRCQVIVDDRVVRGLAAESVIVVEVDS